MSWYFPAAFLSILRLPVLLLGPQELGSLSGGQKVSTAIQIPVCYGVRSMLWSDMGTASATEMLSASLTSPFLRAHRGSTW
jgi:hypothetical protein